MSLDTTKPTQTSTALAVAVTAGIVGLALTEVPLVVRPTLIAIGGALAFAATLWLASGERLTTIRAVAISLLTVPLAAALLVGTAGTVLVLVGAFFPVQTTAQLSAQSLLLIARLGIVVGCVLAVFGVALGVRNVLTGRTLVNHYWVTVKTGLVPALVGGTMLAGTLLTETAASPTGGDSIGQMLSGLGQWLLVPSEGTHLATFFALVAVAAVAVRVTVRALPIAELLGDSGTGETQTDPVGTVTRILGWLGGVGLVATGLALTFELPLQPAELRATLGAELYDWLAVVSTMSALRLVLVGTLAVAVPTLLVLWTLRRVARGSAQSAVRRLAPLVGGATITLAAMAFASPVLLGIVTWIEGRLPPAFAEVFREVSTTTVAFYGAPAIVVAFVAVLAALTVLLVMTFRFALFVGYLSGETAGYSLASAGLFIAAAFAAVIAAPTWLVFGGLVASLLVWDAGHYGTVLGREIGRRAPTRTTELVHAGGTLAVGLVGVALAVGLQAMLAEYTLPEPAQATAAFVGVLAGLILLVAALR